LTFHFGNRVTAGPAAGLWFVKNPAISQKLQGGDTVAARFVSSKYILVSPPWDRML